MVNHPYSEYEETPIWKTVNNAIDTLVANNDIVEKTARRYIVGFIIREIEKEQFTLEKHVK